MELNKCDIDVINHAVIAYRRQQQKKDPTYTGAGVEVVARQRIEQDGPDLPGDFPATHAARTALLSYRDSNA